MRGVFSRLYEPDTIPDDDQAILADIASAIRTPDFDMPRSTPAASNGSRGECHPRALPMPELRHEEGLKLVRPFSTNRVECSSCFSSWIIDVGCRIASADESGRAEGVWTPLPVYYQQILRMPLSPIRSQVRLGLAPAEQIYLISRPRFLFTEEKFPNLRVFAFGRAFLTGWRLIFRTRIGIPLSAPLATIGALSVDPGTSSISPTRASSTASPSATRAP